MPAIEPTDANDEDARGLSTASSRDVRRSFKRWLGNVLWFVPAQATVLTYFCVQVNYPDWLIGQFRVSSVIILFAIPAGILAYLGTFKSEKHTRRKNVIVVALQHVHWYLPVLVLSTIYFYLAPNLPRWGFRPILLIFVLQIPALLLARVGDKRVRKHTTLTAEELVAEDPRPPVLYLRSFADDEVTARRFSHLTLDSEEEELAAVLNDLGPVIAIGEPGEELSELGAARMYLGTDWQSTITNLMANARVVVIRAGLSDGLLWEIRHAIRHVKPERLVFLAPFRKDHYEDFRQTLTSDLPRALPDYPRDSGKWGSLGGVIYFDPDWTPRFARIRAFKVSRDLFSTEETILRSPSGRLKMALGEVYARSRVKWQRSEAEVHAENRKLGITLLIIFGSLIALGFLGILVSIVIWLVRD